MENSYVLTHFNLNSICSSVWGECVTNFTELDIAFTSFLNGADLPVSDVTRKPNDSIYLNNFKYNMELHRLGKFSVPMA